MQKFDRLRTILAVAGVMTLASAQGVLASHDDDYERPARVAGHVYTSSNEAGGNRLMVFARHRDGTLTFQNAVPTGGVGTGGGLGNQSGLARSTNGRYLYMVNAASNNITVFRIERDGPQFIQLVNSGGVRPVSIAVDNDVLYVLNAGGAAGSEDNITGFSIGRHGGLTPIANSTRPLSAPSTAPAQIGFNNRGNVLIVTERATNMITTYTLDSNDRPSQPIPQASSGQTPFGFDFNRQGFLLVSEAFGGAADASAASSYWVSSDGTLRVADASVPTTESAACWLVTTRDGRYAYTTNTASNTVSGFSVGRRTGSLTLLDADGRTAATAAGPIDADIVGNRFLYTLDRAGGQISGFEINHDGSLDAVAPVTNLPTSMNGLVAE